MKNKCYASSYTEILSYDVYYREWKIRVFNSYNYCFFFKKKLFAIVFSWIAFPHSNKVRVEWNGVCVCV